jgi:glycosyltransferase involved in cell wall biosynthesis
MRICRITMTLSPVLIGGLPLHVEELTLHQARRGAQIHLAFAFGEPPAVAGVVPHRVTMRAGSEDQRSTRQKFRFMRCAWPTLWRLARTEKFDVLDVHGDLVEAFFVGLLGRLTHTPSVVTIHGGLSERRRVRWASRLAFLLPTHFIAVSEGIRRQLEARGVVPQRIDVISSGVDLRKIAALPGAPREANTVLFVGRLHAIKGVDVLLAAVPLVQQRIPGARFVIIGDGPERASLRQQSAGLSAVEFAGALPSEVVLRRMQNASVFVSPSISLPGQSEGQPRAVMEAMASGLPVVGSRTGGIVELLEDGKGAKLVPPGDVRLLADAIVELLSNPIAARQMGQHNRERIKGRDFSAIEEKVTAVFDLLTAKRRNK